MLLTFAATEVFFAGAAFLVTPVGLLAFVAVAFLGPLLAPVFAVVFLVIVGTAGVSNTRGFELPVLCSADVEASYAPGCRTCSAGQRHI